MDIPSNTHHQLIEQWVHNSLNNDTVNLKINELGVDENTEAALLKEFKKLKHHKRLSQGFTFIIIGALIGFISCLLTITNIFPDLYNIILFGLTSLAITVAFVGLYFIFEE